MRSRGGHLCPLPSVDTFGCFGAAAAAVLSIWFLLFSSYFFCFAVWLGSYTRPQLKDAIELYYCCNAGFGRDIRLCATAGYIL